MGLVCTILSSRLAFFSAGAPDFFSLTPTMAKYVMTFLVFSVLPAPDSPLKEIKEITEIRVRRKFLWFSLVVSAHLT